MKTFKLRHIAAAAALSASAGFAAGSCGPIAERLMWHESQARLEQRCEEYNAEAQLPKLVGLIAHRAVRESTPLLRRELGAGEDGIALIQYNFSVSPRGGLQMTGADVSCEGGACPGTSELPDMIGVLIASEWSVEPIGRECTMTIKVEVPPLESTQHRVRLPPAGHGVDL